MREREAELRADVDNSTERRTRHDRSPATGPPTSP
jgi:hypothetical protein